MILALAGAQIAGVRGDVKPRGGGGGGGGGDRHSGVISFPPFFLKPRLCFFEMANGGRTDLRTDDGWKET